MGFEEWIGFQWLRGIMDEKVILSKSTARR